MENEMLQLAGAEVSERVELVIADPEHDRHLDLCGFLQVGPTLVVRIQEETSIYQLPDELEWDWDEVDCGRETAGQLMEAEQLPYELTKHLVITAVATSILEAFLSMR